MGKGQRTIKSVVSKILKIFNERILFTITVGCSGEMRYRCQLSLPPEIINVVLCRFGLVYQFPNHRLSSSMVADGYCADPKSVNAKATN